MQYMSRSRLERRKGGVMRDGTDQKLTEGRDSE